MITAALRHGAHYLVGAAALQAGVAFLAQLVLMRLLQPTDFGVFAVTLAAVGLIQAVVSLRLVPAVLRATEAELTEAVAERYHSALCWETVLILVIGAIWLVGWGPEGVWPAALVATLAVGGWAGQVVVFYERGMAYRGLAVLETGVQLLGHATAVLLVLLGAGAGALYLREVAAVVVRLVGMAHLGALPRLRWRWLTLSDWRVLVAETRTLYAEGLLEGLFQRFVILAADAVTGAHGTGILAQAQRLALVPHQFATPVAVRYGANLFGRTEDWGARRRALLHLCGLVALPMAAAAGGAWVLADPLVPWLFGEQWRPAAPVLAAMAGYVLFATLFDTVRVYALTIKATRIVLMARVLQMAVFGGFAAAAASAAEPLIALALGLSAALAAGFAVMLALVVGRRAAPCAG